MKALLFGSLYLLGLASAPCASQDRALSIDSALNHFPVAVNGQNSEDAVNSVLAVLYRHPASAAAVLVKRLAPVAPGKYRHTPQVVWYIRALRSLTGLDFQAGTNAALTDEEKWYLRADSAHRVHFFGWHMAWDETWLAPTDAQIAIIVQWQTWFSRVGKDFFYVNDPHHDRWLY